MAQNPYNNYIKRKAQTNVGANPTVAPKPQANPGVGFKKRVVSNLGGTTPQVSTPSPQNSSSQTTNQYTTPPEANTSPSKPIQPAPQANTPVQTTQPPTQAPIAPDGGTVAPMQVDNAPEMFSDTPSDLSQINELANDPGVIQTAYANGKTPQEYAKELYEQQKAQLQKDWELKQQELKQQQENAQNSFNQSVTDTDKKYGETVDLMNQNRYEQMEDLNVSGTNRGIQYSPQQLGLEQVANIGHNKNLAEASKQRNEMLTQLNQKMMELQAQLTLGSQNAMNEYNKALGSLSAQYNSQLMDWEYDKQMTEEERAWQEKMDKANKEWQSKENALDRKDGRSGGGYGGYGGYSGGRGWKNYKGRGWEDWGSNGYGGGLDLDLSSDIGGKAFTKTFGEMSTDTYNALRSGNELESVQTRADIYREEFDNQIDYAKNNGASDKVINEITAKRNTALKHLYNDAYANSTNTAYKVDAKTKEIPKRPLREDYIQSKKNTQRSDARHYQATNTLDSNKKKEAEFKRDSMAKFENNRKHTKYGTSKSISEKMRDGSYSDKGSKKSSTSKTKESVKKSVSNVSKSTSKAKENNKKAKENSKKNAKKSVSKAKENNKKAKEKSKNNFKKSVKKAVSNVKKSVKKSTDNFKKNVKKKR